MTRLSLIISFCCMALIVTANCHFVMAESANKAETQVKQESALELQLRTIASKLRCPVCQGESVYDSQSPVAAEMKNLISDKIKDGQSADEILTYFKDRYGNFILIFRILKNLKPPYKYFTTAFILSSSIC